MGADGGEGSGDGDGGPRPGDAAAAPTQQQQQQQLQAAATGTRGAALEPPDFKGGDYVEAGDGWWAHKAGQWLYNPSDKAYFHLPTGQLHLAPAEGLLVAFAAPASGEEAAEPAEGAQAEAGAAAGAGAAAAAAGGQQRSSAPGGRAADDDDDVGALLRGSVRWFNPAKGFGFIEPADARGKGGKSADIFFHRNQIVEVEEEHCLRAGARVAFGLGETDDGRRCAVRVRLVAEGSGEDDDDDDDAGRPAKRPRLGRGGPEDGEGAEQEGAEEASDAESSGSSVEVDLFEELKSGLATEKGPTKDRSEDFAVNKAKIPISVLGESATCVFFAVFDGHGGSSCAEYATAHLAKNILSRLRDRPKGVSDEVFLKGGLLGGFKQTEHNFLQHARRVEDRSGCTACTMTVYGPDDESRLRLYVANAGDSRAVLGRVGGDAVRLTEDHKPNLPGEKKRIEAAGGGVAQVAGVWRCMLPRNRVSPIIGLAVSRALGDKDFKPDIVSAEPEITIHEVDWEGDEFVILASDGIWDVISDKDAVRLVQQTFKRGGNEEQAGHALIAKALEKGSADDRTALVVRFGWCRASSAHSAPAAAAAPAGAASAATASSPSATRAAAGGAAAAAPGGASAAGGGGGGAAGEEEDEENDPEVAEAIRAALGLDDDDDEGEEGEEEDAEMDEAVDPDPFAPAAASAASSSSPAGAAAAAAATAAEESRPAAEERRLAEGAPAAAAPSSPPRLAVAAAAAAAAAAAQPAAELGPSIAAGAAAEAAAVAHAAAAEDDLDDIFASMGGDDGDGGAPEGDRAPAPAAAAAAAGGGGPVGMGLFDLALPAPAEEQGPALVGPRKPGDGA